MKKRRKTKSSASSRAAPDLPRLTGWKLWRLRLLSATVVPIVFLLLLELLLRVAGFGHPTSFLLSSVNHEGQKTFVQNNTFGWRFFGKRKSRTPCPISILQKKPPETIRIFVFGESAAFGDPQPAFGLPRVLEATLSLRHPGTKFEVVNAAMTAINSHVIYPIARDCAKADGDIWVIYMGNNEVVGPFGAGTVFGTQSLPVPMVRASLALQSTRLGQLIEAGAEHLRRTPSDKSEWGGMLMFLDQQVPEDDPRLQKVYRNFEINLRDILRAGHDNGAGIVVSTVAVNLKDCAPFASRHRAGLSQADKQKWDDFLNQGTSLQNAGSYAEAAKLFQAAEKLDDANAEMEFRLGKCLLAAGDNTGAQQALGKARDLDTLRFRCDSHLNEQVRKIASGREAEKILLADAEHSFAAACVDGLPGWKYFYEHVHLTFEGNCLLARTLAEQIEKLLPEKLSVSNQPWPSVADCARRLARTDNDLKSAVSEMLGRLTDPPFATQINHEEQVKYLVQKAREAEAHASLTNALQTSYAALKIEADDAQLYEQVAELEDAAGHPAEAEAAARHATELLPTSTEYWSELGHAFVEEKKYDSAADAYQRAFELYPQDAAPLQNVAMALVKLGRKEEAKKEYKRVLAITPHFGLAWLGLGQLLESDGKKKEAEDCYQKALQNRLHHSPELETLARFCMSRGWLGAACTNFDEAVKLDAFDSKLQLEAGEAHFLHGAELGKSGQTEDAVREFREAVRLMPDVVEARINLGIALYRQEKWDESLVQFQEVATRNPDNRIARQYLELLQKKTMQLSH
ncbi:MAG TPA: tetratricopeptide repeat protein [Verrucomicrobiae bacterium]|nr:tetratricopeptide repeat protein [Verrucomicrobiae bacterium]